MGGPCIFQNVFLTKWKQKVTALMFLFGELGEPQDSVLLFQKNICH